MLLSFVAFAIAFFVSLLVLRNKGRTRAIADSHSGPQKIHLSNTPRIGGAAIMAGVAGAVAVAAATGHRHQRELASLFLAALPVFAAGLAEDLTKKVSPRARLAAAAVSAALAIWLLGAVVLRTEVPGLDAVLRLAAPAAWVLTIVAVAGLANAVNIIDGLNGLAGMVVAMLFASLAYVSLLVGDTLVLGLSLLMLGAVAGFFIWNFPAGLIFLGDGGAYLLGLVLAIAAVLLVGRNPQVSAWYPVLLFIYPIFETLFSAYRRLRGRRRSMAAPDASHLHSLVYKRLMRLFLGGVSHEVVRRNSMTAPYLWVLCAMAAGPATIMFRNTAGLVAMTLVFCATYLWVYVRIVRFRTPPWLLAPRRPH